MVVLIRHSREALQVRGRRRQKQSSFTVTTAVQEVVDFLQQLRTTSGLQNDQETDEKLLWCLQMISENRLYDVQVNLREASNRRAGEILPWIRNFSKEQSRRRSSDLLQVPQVLDFSNADGDTEASVPDAVHACLRTVLSPEFDVFELKRASDGNELLTLMVYLFTTSHLLGCFPGEQFRDWVAAVQQGYIASNPYHNSTHAADVVQTFYWMLFQSNAPGIFSLHLLDIACCYLSACIHDFQHPGLSNKFLIMTRHKLAVLYNDKSVLENHHVAAAFSIAEDESKNVFARLKIEEFEYLRKMIIGMVLATDISRHFADLSKFRSRFEDVKEEYDDEDKRMAMEMMLHSCDISNPSKPWTLCRRWAELLIQEYFSQGDQEKALGLPISDLCDRDTTLLVKSQIGFIEVIVYPCFEALSVVIPKLDKLLERLQENKGKWATDQSSKSILVI